MSIVPDPRVALSTPFVSDERTAGGVRVVTLHGEHDVATVDEIRLRLIDAIDAAQGVAVDLRPATFVDSSVLGALVLALRHAHERGVRFAVAVRGGAGDEVLATIERAGLGGVFPLYADRAAAVAAAAGEGGGKTHRL